MKKVLITGSSKGIGKSIAKVLAQAGYEICLTGRNVEVLQKLSLEINAKGYCAVDLMEKNAVEKLICEANKILGNIDILINNAGEYHYASVENTTDDVIDRLITLNTKVPYMLIVLQSTCKELLYLK